VPAFTVMLQRGVLAMKLSDRLTGLFILGLGTVAAYAGSRLPPVPGQQVGPNVFPLVVGVGLGLCGVLIALGVGSRLEEAAEADLAAHTDQAPPPPSGPWLGRFSWLGVLLPPAALVFYALSVETLGFFLTTATMILVASLAFGARLRLALLMMVAGPLVIHLVFYKLLRVPLPPGLVPVPW
jgi:putative tricarboxylic transport membrane protein